MEAQQRVRRRLTAIAVVGTVVVVAAFASLWLRGRPLDVQYALYVFHNGPPAVLLLWLGRLVLVRQPANRVGVVLVTIGVMGALHVAVAATADIALVDYGYTAAITYDHPLIPADLPLSASVPLWVMNWLWVPQVVLIVGILPLIFPDGRLPGPRWRVAPWLTGLGAVALLAATIIDGWPTSTWGVDDTPVIVSALFAVGGLALAPAVAFGLAALVVRWRRAEGPDRDPFRIVGVAAAVLAVTVVTTYPWQQVWIPAALAAMYLLLAAYALAAARYRVHDLEPVLGRAAVAAVLSLLVAGVYVAIVVGIGSLVGRRFDDPVLPLVAVAVVALSVEPVRRRLRAMVDRLLYRRRANRLEVLSQVTASGTAQPAAEVVGEVTELLVRSTGAARVEAWLASPAAGQLVLVAASGHSQQRQPVLCEPVTHREDEFGELRLFARAAADLAPDAPQLVADVAHTLGLVLNNDRLTVQLREQLQELASSRARLVEAHDEARRGLERDIHDGAQARLISLRLRLGVLQARSESNGSSDFADEVHALGHEVDAAVRSLRDLARGLHPPILEQSGPTAALRAATRDLPVPVTVKAEALGRYPPSIEAAAYFCCLEAVQNAVRHASPTSITVELAHADGTLQFRVTDDGRGFDPALSPHGAGLTNLEDRAYALGGRLELTSRPGGGTLVRGWLPAQPASADR